MPTWKKVSDFHYSASHLFSWHARNGAFVRLTPPWERIKIISWEGGEATQHLPPIEQYGDISKGTQVKLQMKVGPFPLQFHAEHTDLQINSSFTDVQRKGPFAEWKHIHRFVPVTEQSSQMDDDIFFRMPLGFGNWFTRKKLEKTFSFRHQRLQNDLDRHQQFADKPRLKVAITGASGMIGRQLTAFLRTGGHQVFAMVRKKTDNPDDIFWSPQQVETEKLEGVDAVIHLAGETIASRWTKSKKQKIRESRTIGTKVLADALASLNKPPKVFISASAIGIYGVSQHERFTEESTLGNDFLAQVCKDWEASAESARAAGIRVVHPRIGLVVTTAGGAVGKMLLPFSLGLGGPVGSGKQWMSWIGLDDLLGVFYHCLYDSSIQGPVNAVSPNAVQNKQFSSELGRALRRPAFLPLPGFAVKLMFGEMGDSLLLQGANVLPSKLQASNFKWFYPKIEQALAFECGS